MSNSIIGRVSALPLVVKADFIQHPKVNAIGYGMLATAQLHKSLPQTGGDGIVHG